MCACIVDTDIAAFLQQFHLWHDLLHHSACSSCPTFWHLFLHIFYLNFN